MRSLTLSSCCAIRLSLATPSLSEYNDDEMDDARDPEGPERERPRPRVVDKRVSAGGGSAPPQPPPEPPRAEPPATERGGAPAASRPAPAGEPLWTPEQEAEAQRLAQQVVETPSRDWVVNTAVTLANVAAAKLEAGLAADAQLAIDSLAAILGSVGSQLGDADGPLRRTLAELQMAYAQSAGPVRRGPAEG
jgi:hypothetical protein